MTFSLTFIAYRADAQIKVSSSRNREVSKIPFGTHGIGSQYLLACVH